MNRNWIEFLPTKEKRKPDYKRPKPKKRWMT